MLESRNVFVGLTFVDANEVYITDSLNDGPKGVTLLDSDGSVTNIPGGAWIGLFLFKIFASLYSFQFQIPPF